MENATLDQLFMILSAGLIMPTVQWLKKYIGPNWPVKPVIFAAGLSLLAVWGLSKWIAPDMTTDEIIAYTLATQFLSQLLHSTHAGLK